MAAPFVHLHVHSSYSPMRGVPSLEDLCAAAKAQGSDTLALTDTNGLYGAIRFLDVAKQTGLHPILGAELTHGAHRAVLLVKDLHGYANLCRLLSTRHCDTGFEFIPAVARYRQGLVILSDDLPALTAWKKGGREDLYVELTPGALMHQAVAFSRHSGLPPAATTRAQFLHPNDYPLHQLLRAIALNTTLSQLPADACCAATHWLMPLSVQARQFPHVPQALANTRRIADACRTDWDFQETIFPAFRQLSAGEAFDLLCEKTHRGAAWRYGTLTPAVRERMDRELAVIRDKGYAPYFLVVEEIVQQAPRTCGRGSAAASLVSYCLGMTHVDPIRHHLFFERFLNPGRHDPPDIDIDFPWDERDRILDWVFARYGARSAAMVANQNTLAIRAAVREVAKVYGLPSEEIARGMAALFRQPDLAPATDPHTWATRVCARLRLRDPWPDILRWAVPLEGHFRHLGLHCGGIVIVPDELRQYVPVEVSAKGVPVIQWEKGQTEDAGLVKIDLLGNRSLAVIRDAVAAIERNTGRRIDYATWDPLQDPATQDLIRRGDTMGCFYVESPATRLLLRKLWGGMPADRHAKADVFEYLVIVSSLIRPAANPFIREFVRRAHGGTYHPLHPALEAVLAETHGIMVYQEDVMQVAMALGGFSVEDGDQLRKVLSKKHKQKQLRDYQAQFYRGAAARGATRAAIDAIWSMILSFAGYSFCKPHSASYAQVSFKSAWLRAHYPAEFMAAVISNQGGFYSTYAYLSEARRMGLTVLPPDLNASEWTYTGGGSTIRVGLMQITGLSRTLADRIIEDRRARGLFRSFQDFLTRVQPEPAQARRLVLAGCGDSIAGDLTRPALLWRLYAWARSRTPDRPSLLANLPTAPLPIPPDYPDSRKIQHEVQTLGFPLSRHPLDLYREEMAGLPCVAGREMARSVGRGVTMIGVLITEKEVRTKDGEPMEFVTFEDQTALYDATLFPDVFRRVCPILATNEVYRLEGLVEEEFGVVTLTVRELERLGSVDHAVVMPTTRDGRRCETP